MTEPVVKYGSIGDFSGPTITGTVEAFEKLPTMSDDHLNRAFWLTTMVESGGKAGSIMAADGTAMTASLEQLVAVYPRNLTEQGSLFGILQELAEIVNILDFLPFENTGWELFEGVLRSKDSAKAVPPKVIRDTFTPIDGKVPVNGPRWEQSKRWAIAFHKLFATPSTIPAQIQYGLMQFVKFSRTKNPRINRSTIDALVYKGNIEMQDPFHGVTVNDLAMAVWWSYKVNGPAPALDRLGAAARMHATDSPEFGQALICSLRTSQYGRWATNRYDRTRQHAMKVWPPEFFNGKDAVMPSRK